LAGGPVGALETPCRRARAGDVRPVRRPDSAPPAIGRIEPRVGAPRHLPPLALVAQVAGIVVRRRVPPPRPRDLGRRRPRRARQIGQLGVGLPEGLAATVPAEREAIADQLTVVRPEVAKPVIARAPL